jgi:hypothetical protein
LTLAEGWNIAYGAIVGIVGIVALLLVLMIGLCLALDWTKFRPTLNSRTVRSLDETVGAPTRYLPPNAPRGPVDQLARSIRATS